MVAIASLSKCGGVGGELCDWDEKSMITYRMQKVRPIGTLETKLKAGGPTPDPRMARRLIIIVELKDNSNK